MTGDAAGGARGHRFGRDYRETAWLADGTQVLIRRVQPEDAALLVRGFRRLSAESRYRRFLTHKKELSPEEIRFFTEYDEQGHFAIAALTAGAADEEGVGVARFVRLAGDRTTAEVAVTVVDAFQRRGAGRLLLERLFLAAAEWGIRRLQFVALPENEAMLGLLRGVAPAMEIRAAGPGPAMVVCAVVPGIEG